MLQTVRCIEFSRQVIPCLSVPVSIYPTHPHTHTGINVPRSRFLPVKKSSDLLLTMSNLFTMEHGALKMNPARSYPALPLVKLGDPDFTKVNEQVVCSTCRIVVGLASSQCYNFDHINGNLVW